MSNIFYVLDIPFAELDAQPTHSLCFYRSPCIYCEAKILRQYAQNALEDEIAAWEDYLLEEAERVRTRADVWEWFNADPPDDGYDD